MRQEEHGLARGKGSHLDSLVHRWSHAPTPWEGEPWPSASCMDSGRDPENKLGAASTGISELESSTCGLREPKQPHEVPRLRKRPRGLGGQAGLMLKASRVPAVLAAFGR